MRAPITLITTVRDGDILLDRYFDNVTSILGPNDHAVIVDDGSTNAVSCPISDARINILHSSPIGRGAALNLAISKSPTDLIAIQDIDDLSLPGRLDQQALHLTQHPDNMLFTRAVADPWRPHFNAPRQINPARLYLGNPLHHSSLAMHRDVWERAGGYATDLPCCIDLDFYLRASTKGRSKLWQLNAPLIDRNLDLKTRYFAAIPKDIYLATRQSVLDQYRPHLRPSFWFRVARIKRLINKIGVSKS
jgi:glycosyltransferase involved in cell wall biosynthesis